MRCPFGCSGRSHSYQPSATTRQRCVASAISGANSRLSSSDSARALIGSGPARSLRAHGGIRPQRSARAPAARDGQHRLGRADVEAAERLPRHGRLAHAEAVRR